MSTLYFKDLLGLSTRVLDTLNYIQPFVSALSFISSLICAMVCMNHLLKGVIYQHLLLDSIVSTVYSALNAWTWIIRCGARCEYGYNYWSKVYELYVFLYFKQSLEVFMLLIEIHITYLKLRSFSVKSASLSPATLYARFAFFFIVSFAVGVPLIIIPRKIDLLGYLLTSPFGLNDTSSNFTASDLRPLYIITVMDKNSSFMKGNLALGIVQGVGLLCVNFLLNLVLYLKFRSFLAKKKKLPDPERDKKIEQKEKSSTIRIVVLAINCSIGYFPNKLANNSLLYIFSIDTFNFYIPFSNMLIWLSISFKLLINLAFDRSFRETFFVTLKMSNEQTLHFKRRSTMPTFPIMNG